ncbi:MAG: aminopeptidase [Bacteriovoracaceae bacterium]
MKTLFLISAMALLSASCAKMSYLASQGVGQVALEWNGRSNQEVLNDKKVKTEHKEKIKKIIDYKKFFYSYFGKEPTAIYEQTTFLKQPAVTYLVVASAQDEIQPLEHTFPVMGRFPYLGFFDVKDAKKFAKGLEKQEYETFIRPVFAYSTLNQWIFDDNILSSFFNYDDVELAELVFHELFHTIYFVKDEVSLNENLAQFFSRELVFEYFNYDNLQRARYISRKSKEKKLTQKLVELTNQLRERYGAKGRVPSEARQIRETFMREVFKPQMALVCDELELENCWPLKKSWNNARFAAFLTYESGQNEIEKLKKGRFSDLKLFFTYLVQEADDFKAKSSGKKNESFESHLFSKSR